MKALSQSQQRRVKRADPGCLLGSNSTVASQLPGIAVNYPGVVRGVGGFLGLVRFHAATVLFFALLSHTTAHNKVEAI